MPAKSPPAIVARAVIALLFLYLAALQIRFTAVTVEVLSNPTSFPAIPTLDTTTLQYTVIGTASFQAGIRKGDILLAVNGQPIHSRAEVARLFFAHKPGETVLLTLRRGSALPFTVNYQIAEVLDLNGWSSVLVLIILNIFTPWCCILLGFLVVFRRPNESLSWMLLLLLICVSQAFRGYGDPPYGWPLIFSWPALFFDVFAIPGMAASWLWVAVQFPDPRSPNRIWPWARWVLGIPFFLVYAIQAVWFATSIHYPHAAPWLARINQIQIPDSATNLWAIAAILFSGLNLAVKLKRETNLSIRRRLRWSVFGLVCGILPAPIALIFTDGDLSRLPWPLLFTCLISPLLIPLTLAYALLVDRMLDLGVVVRQGLLASRTVAVIRTVALAAFLYLAIFFLSQKLVPGLTRLAELAGCIAAALLTIRGAEWLRNKIDHYFFQEAVNSERLLTELSSSLRGVTDAETLLQTVTQRISDAMHPSSVNALMPQAGGFAPVSALPGTHALTLSVDDPALVELKASRRPLQRSADLLVPISNGQDLRGILQLGPRLSEEPYSSRDVSLLESTASQTALALENTRLTASVAAEAANRERITTELELARTVQERLFPKAPPNVPGLDLAGRCRPAQAVGGDYFDFFTTPSSATGFAVGDIAGKGVPAALLMASLQASLRAITLPGVTDLADLMAKLNLLMYDASPANRFATFFCCLYSPDTGKLLYCSAGHNPALLWRADTRQAVWLNTQGIALGLRRKSTYQQAETTLQPGDRLVLYTDGVTEARNLAGEEFGEQRLTETISNAPRSSAGELADTLLEATIHFAGTATQHDDITLITAVRRS